MSQLYKTIYLDIDEEITSIVERLKKSEAKEIILVVPRKAILLQSIVNLKILRKEADRLKKKIVINTSDKIGKNLSEKVGFVVHKKFEDRFKIQDRNKLNAFESGVEQQPAEGKKFIEQVKSIKIMDIVEKKEKGLKVEDKKNKIEDEFFNVEKKVDKVDKEPESILNKTQFLKTTNETKKKTISLIPSLNAKFFLGFLIVCFVITILIGLIVLPKAEIILTPRTEPIISNLEITIDKNIQTSDFQTNKIPGRLISVQKEKEKEFTATGKKKIYEKAKGIITVYNEWGISPQTLVANTRFLSKEGKIFRTTKTIKVPGFKRIEGNDIPGTIEVEVVAAGAGEEYNINPTSFTIPGFEGSPKYASIYGRSAEAMKGGKIGEAIVVSKDDLEKAKEFLSQGIKEETIAAIKKEASEKGFELLDGAIQEVEIEYIPNVEVGTIAEKFSLKAKSFAQAMIFSKEEVKKMALENLFSKLSEQKEIISKDEIFNYGDPTLDISTGQMTLPVNLEGIVRWKIDPSLIKEDLLGKNEGELKEYLSNLKEIEKAKVSFWPFWVERVPLTTNRVYISIDSALIPK